MTNVTVMHRARTTIVLHPDITIKTYNQPDWAAYEISFYRMVPWACPPLIWADAGTLVTKPCRWQRTTPTTNPSTT